LENEGIGMRYLCALTVSRQPMSQNLQSKIQNPKCLRAFVVQYVIIPATPDHIDAARTLFLEYAAALGFNLCFQSFDEELSGLPGQYAPPDGCLLLASSGEDAVGCVALRKLEDGICEMKRLYVQPRMRGTGLGRKLAEEVIAAARMAGYRKMRLDTMESMTEARALYRKLGFSDIPPYYHNPMESVAYMELALRGL